MSPNVGGGPQKQDWAERELTLREKERVKGREEVGGEVGRGGFEREKKIKGGSEEKEEKCVKGARVLLHPCEVMM